MAPVLSMAEELIAQIEAAYEGQDRDAYAQLFDPERFVFVFDPIDVQENPDLPDSWGWPEEESVHRNMFEGGEVESIQLDWDSVQNLPVTQWDGAGEPLPPGTREVVVSGVHLTIEVRDPQGEILVFEVEGDRAHLFVARENAGALGGSPPRWKILRWQDERVGGKLATETLSWGVVKSFFR